MSDYKRIKAIRVPLEKYGYKEDPYALEDEKPDAFKRINNRGFEITGCDGRNGYVYYLDYILEDDCDCDGDWGKVRNLYENERIKYQDLFAQVISNIDMNDARLVEYCWYNCCEPYDYYDISSDEFYDEV